jgi:hypothetical protein
MAHSIPLVGGPLVIQSFKNDHVHARFLEDDKRIWNIVIDIFPRDFPLIAGNSSKSLGTKTLADKDFRFWL